MFEFAQDLDTMSPFNKIEIINRLKKVIIGEKEFIKSSDVLNFSNTDEEIEKSIDGTKITIRII